jgi:hypothetical protein
MAVESVVYMFIALAIEFGSARAVLVNLFSPTPKPSELSLKLKQLSERTPEDADVVKERQRIQNGGAKDDLIRLEGMRKVYTTGKVAVENLWYPHHSLSLHICQCLVDRCFV